MVLLYIHLGWHFFWTHMIMSPCMPSWICSNTLVMMLNNIGFHVIGIIWIYLSIIFCMPLWTCCDNSETYLSWGRVLVYVHAFFISYFFISHFLFLYLFIFYFYFYLYFQFKHSLTGFMTACVYKVSKFMGDIHLFIHFFISTHWFLYITHSTFQLIPMYHCWCGLPPMGLSRGGVLSSICFALRCVSLEVCVHLLATDMTIFYVHLLLPFYILYKIFFIL